MNNFKEIPVNKRSLVMRKLVCGVGVNDADYIVYPTINGKIERCPYYTRWVGMIQRCYDPKCHARYPTYINCYVCEEWMVFSNFKRWMQNQDWKGKDLDKDILFNGNKVYGPDTCVFIAPEINKLLNDSAATRGSYPQGVCYEKSRKKYKAQCTVSGKPKKLGRYQTQEEASAAYKEFKYKLIANIANEQTEPLKSALLAFKL